MNLLKIASRIALNEDEFMLEPPEEPPYKSFEEQQSEYEDKLKSQIGKFLVFHRDGSLSISDNLLDAKDSSRVDHSKVRKLNKGYSDYEFEEGWYERSEINSDDDFFWDEDNHQIV